MEEGKREYISYNKKFKPGSVGVKLTFAPDEMAFSREDMPLKAAIARRDVLLTLQPQVDGVSKIPWNGDVHVSHMKEPYNPHTIYVSTKNENDPDFRRDFYDPSLPWDAATTIDKKREAKQFQNFTLKSKENTIKKSQPLVQSPCLVKRQKQYAKKIKENGIPAAQPPPQFVVHKPKISNGSKKIIRKSDIIQRYHDGTYSYCDALGGNAWSCCGNCDKDSPGCRKKKINQLTTLYD
ncbi:hypothetical protein GPJ56_002149 [Histomonas meleagridis]|uniref:uncharacterized protein n=1 Tax=Histomonas meleagridis TaxID=135588 RepID=UPI003559FB80|nr:hypothetical protein GPJ56_002149 [Histomonas meleagridis]KAH0806672.1 hypothetical protein GO595_000523 [Histomonas meleagridis]